MTEAVTPARGCSCGHRSGPLQCLCLFLPYSPAPDTHSSKGLFLEHAKERSKWRRSPVRALMFSHAYHQTGAQYFVRQSPHPITVKTCLPFADRLRSAVDRLRNVHDFSFSRLLDLVPSHSLPQGTKPPITEFHSPLRYPLHVRPLLNNQGFAHARDNPRYHPQKANPSRSGASPYARCAAHEGNPRWGQQARTGESGSILVDVSSASRRDFHSLPSSECGLQPLASGFASPCSAMEPRDASAGIFWAPVRKPPNHHISSFFRPLV